MAVSAPFPSRSSIEPLLFVGEQAVVTKPNNERRAVTRSGGRWCTTTLCRSWTWLSRSAAFRGRTGRVRQPVRQFGQYPVVELRPGDLVTALSKGGERIPARVVSGPEVQGEFTVVILCDPDDWDIHRAGGKPGGYWEEWKYPWPVESIEGWE